ncbi:MAG: hypothetical protein U5J62_01035 [Desulfurivibrio sp.]|nr:hypothetical protein [Desulfurivibrio sp.]
MNLLDSITGFIADTGIPEQLSEVEVVGLFTNPWFLVPFLVFIGYQLYRQSLNTLVLVALLIGLWAFSGTPLMEDLIIDGELQLGKLLPVIGVGLGAAAIAIYFFFIRSD